MLITHYKERPCLWDVGHEDYMNRSSKELVYSQTDLLMSDRNDISLEDYKHCPQTSSEVCEVLGSQFIFVCMCSSFVFREKNVSFFSHQGSKTFFLASCSFSHHSATKEQFSH